MRATRSGRSVEGDPKPSLVVSLGQGRRASEMAGDAAEGEGVDPPPPPPKRPRKEAPPLFDPADNSPEGRYQCRFHQLRHKQLQRLSAARAEWQQSGRLEAATASDRFDFLMHCVQAFTQGSSKAGTKSKGARRGGGPDEDAAEDDDAGAGGLAGTPPYLTGELRAYQVEGVNWLIRLFDAGLNGILADEMGLGKTFQTVALLAYLKKTRGIGGPHLVVCPLSILINWCREVSKWCPELRVLKFHGSKEERAELKVTELLPGKYDVVVTTYEVANMEKSALQKFHWKYIIVDEAHRLKNEASLLSHTMRLFRSNHRMLVTGTPLQNNLHELWALLNFLLPDLFVDAEEFDAWYNAKDGHSEANVIQQMHRLLRPFMLRRLKSEVNTSIPPKKEIYVGCGMTKMQREWYTNVLAKDAQVVNTGTGNKTKLLNVVMQLRKTCSHPYLFEGAEEGPPFFTDETLVNVSGKMRVLDKLLARLKAGGHRVLLFCQMTRMLDILEDYVVWRSYAYCRLDGSTGPMERDERMEQFNAPDSPLFLFMLSTRAGGLGINLATADTVILYDSDWNPQVDLQAQDRAHRIGQKKPVTIFRLIADGTVEERIYQRALKKLYLDAAVIQQGRLQDGNTAASKDELLSMIRFGAEQMFKSRDEDVTDEDIDILLSRGEAKTSSLTSKLAKDCQMSLLNFSMGIEDSNLYEFEGVNYTVQPSRQLYVKNIDTSVGEAELRMAFMDFGELKRIVISPDRDLALVEFGSIAAATQAYAGLGRSRQIGACRDVEVIYGTKANLGIVGVQEIQDTLTVKAKRTCVVDYKEAQLAAAQHQAAELSAAELKGPKLPKKPTFPAYQFFDTERLEQLWEEECKFILQEHQRKIEEKKARLAQKKHDELLARRRRAEVAAADRGPSPKDGDAEAAAAESSVPKSPMTAGQLSPAQPLSPATAGGSPAKGEAEGEEDEEEDEGPKDDDANPLPASDRALTSAELREKERLLREGFPEWRNGDYHRFVKAVVECGRDDLEGICRQMADKEPGEVRRYSAAFWSLGPTRLPESDWNRALKRIEKAQADRDAHSSRAQALQWKLGSLADPTAQLTFSTAFRPAVTWDDEEDRQLAMVTHEVGYGKWDEIQRRLQAVPALAFDWPMKVRGPAELKVRAEHLVRAIEREQQQLASPGEAGRAPKPAANRTRGRTKQTDLGGGQPSPPEGEAELMDPQSPTTPSEQRSHRASRRRT
eukprot:EG_transcript_744